MKYNFKITQPYIGYLYIKFDMSVEKPYEYLSYLSEDSPSSAKFTTYIQGINDVVNNVTTFFTFGNQSGIIIDVDVNGCHVFDEFDDVFCDEEMYCVDHTEMLQLLTDYRDFLVANGK